MEKAKEYHHYLVTGEVVFSVKDREEIHALRLNAIVVGDSTKIAIRVIGKAQQALQMQFHQRMEDPSINVRDVVIMNMTYLGFMSEEEFKKPPEGMTMQEAENEESDLLDPNLEVANNPFH